MTESTNTIRVIHIPQNDDEPVTVRHIAPGPASMQEQVEGLIECFTSVSDIDLWGNDEARLIGMGVNRHANALAIGMGFFTPRALRRAPLVGPVLVAGANGEGETVGLTDDQIIPVLGEVTQRDTRLDRAVTALIADQIGA